MGSKSERITIIERIGILQQFSFFDCNNVCYVIITHSVVMLCNKPKVV